VLKGDESTLGKLRLQTVAVNPAFDSPGPLVVTKGRTDAREG